MGEMTAVTFDMTYFYATGGVMLAALAGIWVFRKVKALLGR